MFKFGFKLKHWRKWLYRRVIRLQGSAHGIAMGMAVGVFFGFLMPPGAQMLVAVPVALLIGANVITAFAGTCVTNPFTYIPFYYFTCRVGQSVLNFFGADFHLGKRVRETIHQLGQLDFREAWDTLARQSLPFLASWVCGGIIVGTLCAILAYYLTRLVVIEFHKVRSHRHVRRAARLEAAHPEPAATAPVTATRPDKETPEEQVPP